MRPAPPAARCVRGQHVGEAALPVRPGAVAWAAGGHRLPRPGDAGHHRAGRRGAVVSGIGGVNGGEAVDNPFEAFWQALLRVARLRHLRRRLVVAGPLPRPLHHPGRHLPGRQPHRPHRQRRRPADRAAPQGPLDRARGRPHPGARLVAPAAHHPHRAGRGQRQPEARRRGRPGRRAQGRDGGRPAAQGPRARHHPRGLPHRRPVPPGRPRDGQRGRRPLDHRAGRRRGRRRRGEGRARGAQPRPDVRPGPRGGRAGERRPRRAPSAPSPTAASSPSRPTRSSPRSPPRPATRPAWPRCSGSCSTSTATRSTSPPCPSWSGWPTGTSLLAFDGCSVLGWVTADGAVELNPPADATFGAGYELIAVAEDDDKVVFTGVVAAPAVTVDCTVAFEEPSQRVLMIGWSDLGPGVLSRARRVPDRRLLGRPHGRSRAVRRGRASTPSCRRATTAPSPCTRSAAGPRS